MLGYKRESGRQKREYSKYILTHDIVCRDKLDEVCLQKRMGV